ncbi:MAG: 4-hydroxybenzoyl-CoA reductase subunit beta [Candidatus Paceibacteria bacterium]|jgi:4-hydroxybenzoyl-CoA reductase subunit beta
MLRLPAFELHEPLTIEDACALAAELGSDAKILAGGTDLLPNLKHELYDSAHVISLRRIPCLRGFEMGGHDLVIGAMTPLDEVASSPLVLQHAPALAQATAQIAGPQHRQMGTLGGNVMLDTRCQWINQTHFWREALGFCIKKDGSLCHVVEGGKKCVAAASNDSAPALMSLGAILSFATPSGAKHFPIDELWVADGVNNKCSQPGEILTEIRIPLRESRHLGAYGKLRERHSIDFPMLGCAVRLEVDEDNCIIDGDVVMVALQARPLRIKRVKEMLSGKRVGSPELETAVGEVAQQAHKQCKPLDNIPGDKDYRRRMVPVYVKRTLLAALDS